jgi:hypothetical protein
MSELVEALQHLQIGDRVGMGTVEVLGVPGGWIFTTETCSGNVTSCFVPLPQNQVQMENNKIQIAMPSH